MSAMATATIDLVQQLSSAADDVARNLPEAHWLTRRYRQHRFRAAVERVIGLLYKLDVPALTDEQLREAERLTRAAVNVLEAHMLLAYTPADVADCRYCAALRDRLRDALDALDSGLPMDPAKRPSEQDILASLAADLEAVALQRRTS